MEKVVVIFYNPERGFRRDILSNHPIHFCLYLQNYYYFCKTDTSLVITYYGEFAIIRRIYKSSHWLEVFQLEIFLDIPKWNINRT